MGGCIKFILYETGLGSGQKPNGGGGGACGCSSFSLLSLSVPFNTEQIIIISRPAVSFSHVYLYINSLVHTYFLFCARVPGS